MSLEGAGTQDSGATNMQLDPAEPEVRSQIGIFTYTPLTEQNYCYQLLCEKNLVNFLSLIKNTSHLNETFNFQI